MGPLNQPIGNSVTSAFYRCLSCVFAGSLSFLIMHHWPLYEPVTIHSLHWEWWVTFPCTRSFLVKVAPFQERLFFRPIFSRRIFLPLTSSEVSAFQTLCRLCCPEVPIFSEISPKLRYLSRKYFEFQARAFPSLMFAPCRKCNCAMGRKFV